MATYLSRRAFGALVGASLALSALSGPVRAEAEELIFNVFIPRQAPLFKKGLEPWAREVEAASNGSLSLTIPTSTLAPPARVWDIVQDGVADLAIAPLAFRDKQLTLYKIGSLPLVAETAKGASAALWDTHESYFKDADQWDEFVPLSLFTLGAPAIISTQDPILSKADLDGFKMLAVGKDKIATWKNLGASPVGGKGQKPFEFLSSGVADGATNPLGTAVVQGLLEAAQNVTRVPGGMGGRATFVLFMNRDRFEGLSEEAQNALLSTSGGVVAAKLGKIMDGHDAFGLKKFNEKGIMVHDASDAFVSEIAEAGAFLVDNWMALAEKAGVDGKAALDHFATVAAQTE